MTQARRQSNLIQGGGTDGRNRKNLLRTECGINCFCLAGVRESVDGWSPYLFIPLMLM